MKSVSIFFLLIGFLGLFGCHRPLAAPELTDPVYLDLKRNADSALSSISEAQKDIEKAKAALDGAPIRTGQRQDAMEDYFQAQNKLEKLIENYRFLALKTHSQLAKDRASYGKAFKEKKSWPDPEEVQTYKVERKLAQAPREWNPEDRIKKKVPVAPAAEEHQDE